MRKKSSAIALIYRNESIEISWHPYPESECGVPEMYKRIVVPIDLSHAEQGREMAALAKKLADPAAEIHLVNVIEEIPSYIVSELPKDLREKSLENAKETLEEIAGSAGIETPVSVRMGRVSSEIIAMADEHDADIIIIASHRPGLQDLLLGSTAARVVRHSKHSVLVLR
jgi:universal stress protein F